MAQYLFLFWIGAALLVSNRVVADEKDGSSDSSNAAAERFRRANELPGLYQGKVSRERLDWHWLEGGKAWYGVRTEGGRVEYYSVDMPAGVRRPLYDSSKVAAALSEVMNQAVEPENLTLEDLSVDSTGTVFSFRYSDRWWRYLIDSNELQPSDRPSGNGLPAQSRSIRSRGQGPETYIRFVNRTKAPLRLWWMKADGSRVPYGAVEPGKEREQHTFSGHAWLVTRGDSELHAAFRAVAGGGIALLEEQMTFTDEAVERSDSRGNRRAANPPVDVPWRTEVVDGNLVLVAKEGQQKVNLTSDGSRERPYQGPFLWSPDGKYLLCGQLEPGERRTITLIDSRPDKQVQPTQQTIRYDKPGDRLDIAWPRLFKVGGEKAEAIPLATDLYANPWSLGEWRWDEDSTRFTMLYNQRGHQVIRWLAVEPSSGSVSILWEESSPTFVDYAHKQQRRELPETDELLWMSERNGWCHLYLHDSRTGQLKHSVTSGEWIVRGIERLDAESRNLWVAAGGYHAGEDPYHRHLLRASLDGGTVVPITAGDGNHEWSFSPDGKYVLDRYSRVDLPPVHQVRDAFDGRLLVQLEEADWSELIAAGWQAPERFVAKGRDGETDIYGMIIRPSHFQSGKKYPVIEQIYAGPQELTSPKGSPCNSEMCNSRSLASSWSASTAWGRVTATKPFMMSAGRIWQMLGFPTDDFGSRQPPSSTRSSI